MRILIARGYSYIGAGIAEKFISLKHSVTIIDNIYDSEKCPVSAKHKFFNSNMDKNQYEKIFDAGRFDYVLYISQSLDLHHCSDKKNDDPDIINILNLSAKNNVKKFILLSSAEIYGTRQDIIYDEEIKPDPASLSSILDNIREYCTVKIGEMFKMPVLCLRVSGVYGVNDDIGFLKYTKETGAVYKNPLNDLIAKAILSRYGVSLENNETFHGLIYIDDAIEAIFKTTFAKECTGILNISSDKDTPAKTIMKIISGALKIKTAKQKNDDKNPQSVSIKISNKKIRDAVGWKSSTDIKEGILKTIKTFLTNYENKKKKTIKKEENLQEKPANKKTAGHVLLTIFENFVLFVFFAFLGWGDLFFNIRLPDAIIDYSIIYIIIVAVMWGQAQGYIAMILSSILFIGMSIYTGTDIITFIYTPENLIRLAIYLLVGIITGYSIERRNRQLESNRISYQSLSNKYLFLLDIYNQTKVIKNELEKQVVSSEDSFSNIYSIVQKVENLEIEAIYRGAVEAIEKILKTESVSVYIRSRDKDNEFMRLKSRSLSLAGKIPNSIKISDYKQLKYVVENKCLYINKNFEPSIPLMIAPVVDDKKVIAAVSVHDAEFENITANYENLFKTVISLITNTIKRAYYFEEILKHKRYLNGTSILNADTFEKIFSQIRKNQEELDMSYALLQIERDEKTLEDISATARSGIRENDYLGEAKDGKIYVLLSNTQDNYAYQVVKRLIKKGLKTVLIKEEEIDE